MGLFCSDPITEPLTYPGRVPATSGVLVDDAYLPVEEVDTLLVRLGRSSMAERYPIVAVGSNASPGQLLRKFGGHAVIPMTLADVDGVVPGVAAYVSRWGYVPATPVGAPGERSRLFVLWLDERELVALDATEPNYWRRRLPYAVTLESGVRLASCFFYVVKHGCLVDGNGVARRLTDQRVLIQGLLEEFPGLRRLCGRTPEEFVAAVQDEAIREAIFRLFHEPGTVSCQLTP
ncbi:hypothetical protein [Nonomuraea typhae]|uniref:hypothetical protein n=1 Tax=Nonomuraea typhae TaxID=2603600 RepID=UPI0012FC2DCE|nr:hypothetical protein [Nonomuraea typhae]